MHNFVITIAVFNAERWIERCLVSALDQEFGEGLSMRIMIVDDASTDRTYDIALKTLDGYEPHYSLWRNQSGQGALKNYREMIGECADDEIIINLDGDDQLAHKRVLKRLAEEYSDPRVWMTYGSFNYDHESRNPNGDARGMSAQVPPDRHNRTHGWSCSHLRTYYAWLFKKIREEDFLFEGKYFQAAPDLAIMYPMIEMCGPGHARYIPDVLYLYNAVNPLGEVKLRKEYIDRAVADIQARAIYPCITGR